MQPEPTRIKKWLYIMSIVIAVLGLVLAAIGMGYGLMVGVEVFWAWAVGIASAFFYLYWLKLDRELGPWIDEQFFGDRDGSE
jgi:hypothetical protein